MHREARSTRSKCLRVRNSESKPLSDTTRQHQKHQQADKLPRTEGKEQSDCGGWSWTPWHKKHHKHHSTANNTTQHQLTPHSHTAPLSATNITHPPPGGCPKPTALHQSRMALASCSFQAISLSPFGVCSATSFASVSGPGPTPIESPRGSAYGGPAWTRCRAVRHHRRKACT